MRITTNNTSPEQAAVVLHRTKPGLLVVRGGPNSGKRTLIRQYVHWLLSQGIKTYVFANKGGEGFPERCPTYYVRRKYTMRDNLKRIFKSMQGVMRTEDSPRGVKVVIIDDIDNYMKGGMEMSAFRGLQLDASVHMVVVVSDDDKLWVAEGPVNYPWDWINLDPTPPFVDNWDEAPHA